MNGHAGEVIPASVSGRAGVNSLGPRPRPDDRTKRRKRRKAKHLKQPPVDKMCRGNHDKTPD